MQFLYCWTSICDALIKINEMFYEGFSFSSCLTSTSSYFLITFNLPLTWIKRIYFLLHISNRHRCSPMILHILAIYFDNTQFSETFLFGAWSTLKTSLSFNYKCTILISTWAPYKKYFSFYEMVINSSLISGKQDVWMVMFSNSVPC